jgi:hypothetical protein
MKVEMMKINMKEREKIKRTKVKMKIQVVMKVLLNKNL